MELNMPFSGAGLTMRFAAAKLSWSNSVASGFASAAQTTAICDAANCAHVCNRWPSTEFCPHGKSNFGRPIRRDAPAARMMTPNLQSRICTAEILVEAFRKEERGIHFGLIFSCLLPLLFQNPQREATRRNVFIGH